MVRLKTATVESFVERVEGSTSGLENG
ncbi:uncharacterized protein METZ01_LOCUS295437 [marine metagenome]|uniref:Uncharacterized protein n=1 Tax=marine metagenome TaxID=408172 RepID=A0A382M128_9ZZZZ